MDENEEGIADSLRGVFEKEGVDVAKPGFYDHPAFLQLERKNPRVLELYALYVKCRSYGSEYVEFARLATPRATQFLYEVLERDGRRGACIDAMNILTRFLERLGVWCYGVSGALTIDFPSASRLPKQYFWPIRGPRNPAKTGHAWVSAPPFRIVDFTLGLQPYNKNQQQYLPRTVVAEQTHSHEVTLGDLVEPEAMHEIRSRFGRTPSLSEMAQTNARSMLECVSQFGSHKVSHEGTTLTYVSCAIHACDGPLEENRSFCPSVKDPAGLFNQFVSWAKLPSITAPPA